MYLTRLEINGFKSFAHKTVFEFPSGIVAVVGPNGSGKSNVIDAIRWVLGEREAKNLRGDSIEDLIFAGTTKRPRLSQARVTLVFDNSKGHYGMDATEIVISRSVARNGTSQYSMNGASVRLKDLIDFFSKIRLGSKGLSVIGQGSGDMFVSSTPQQRMMMVQEILGLREYELKKNDAQRKLDGTRSNLEKIHAMMQEVLPRLRTLKRQTSKWEKRSDIEQELAQAQEIFFVGKIVELLQLRATALEHLPSLETKQRQLEELLKKSQDDLSVVEQSRFNGSATADLQQKKRALFDQRRVVEKDVARAEAELEHLATMATAVSLDVSVAHDTLTAVRSLLDAVRSSSSVEALRDAIGQALSSIDRIFADEDSKSATSERAAELSATIQQLEQSLQESDGAIAVLEEAERAYAQEAETFNQRFRTAFETVQTHERSLRALQEQRQTIVFEEEKIAYRMQELARQADSFGLSFADYQKKAQEAGHHILNNEFAQTERTILRLRSELASMGEVDEALVREASEVEQHYEFLKKECADLEDASENLFVLIRELEHTITKEFSSSFKKVNAAFNEYFRSMFGGGSATMKVIKKEPPVVANETESEEGSNSLSDSDEDSALLFGIDVAVSIPQKKIAGLDMLSGGERSLVSLAVLFALVSVSPPPFLVLDEVDAALDERNSHRFGQLIQTFAHNTQFIVVTHNRVTMEAARILYGVTMDEGVSKVLSLKLEDAKEVVGEQE